MIKGLHHNAYRCRDSEETRAFYEDFLGLRMVSAFEINEGRALHTFFEMDDGSCLAFFEVPGSPFDFKRQDSLDLHIALGVEPETFDAMLEKAKGEGREVRGPVDHRFVRSIYFRDPNGYVIELTASTGKHGEIMDPAISKPHEALAHWQATRAFDRAAPDRGDRQRHRQPRCRGVVARRRIRGRCLRAVTGTESGRRDIRGGVP